MSKYTTEVRYICEHYAGLTESEGYDSVNDILNESYDKVFDFDFPIFDEAYRPVLCKKILKHYYVREIGEETVGLWKLKLDSRMNEIMPYYNKMYELAQDGLGLFDDTNLHKTGERTGESNRDKDTSNSNSIDTVTENLQTFNDTVSTDGMTRNLYSDTPQGALTNVDNEQYLTDYRKILDEEDRAHTGTVRNNATNNSEGVGTESVDENINTTEDYLEHIYGKSGGKTYAELLMKYKDSLVDIDMLIINNLSDLFMNIW